MPPTNSEPMISPPPSVVPESELPDIVLPLNALSNEHYGLDDFAHLKFVADRRPGRIYYCIRARVGGRWRQVATLGRNLAPRVADGTRLAVKRENERRRSFGIEPALAVKRTKGPNVTPATHRRVLPLHAFRALVERVSSTRTADAIGLFLDSRRAKGLSPATIQNYSYQLAVFARAVSGRLPDKPDEIERFLLSRPQWSDRTRETYYQTLRIMYGWLERRGHIKRNPIPQIETPRTVRKVARSLTPPQLEALLMSPKDAQLSAFLYLLADTGLRLGEALSVRLDRVRPDTVVVEGKVGEREVPISPKIRRLTLRALPWPWTTTWGVGFAVRRAFRRAGINGHRASAQTLRHTFVREWRGDESLLVGIMGWTSARMMKVYRPYDLERAIIQHRYNSRRRRKLT